MPADHPLRAIRRMTDAIFDRLSPRFDRLYSTIGRPSIPPEKLLRALLLQGLYTVRSERLLMEQLQYNLLFRWFVGLSMDDPVWDATTFTKNRDRLLEGDIATAFFEEVLAEAKAAGLRVGRAFHGRRHVAGGVGEPEEFPATRTRRPTRPMTLGIRRSISAVTTRKNDTHQSTTDPGRATV